MVDGNDAAVERNAVGVVVEPPSGPGEIAELVRVIESHADDGATAEGVVHADGRPRRVLLEARLEAGRVFVEKLIVTSHEDAKARTGLISAAPAAGPSLGQPLGLAPLLVGLAESALHGGDGAAATRSSGAGKGAHADQRTDDLTRSPEPSTVVAQNVDEHIVQALRAARGRRAENQASDQDRGYDRAWPFHSRGSFLILRAIPSRTKASEISHRTARGQGILGECTPDGASRRAHP